MKAVALILALAIITGECAAGLLVIYICHLYWMFVYVCFLLLITGCNARAVRQVAASLIPWEGTMDRFTKVISDLSQQATGVVQNIKASQLNRELEWVSFF